MKPLAIALMLFVSHPVEAKPLAWYLVKVAHHYEVPLPLLGAIIRAESSGRQWAQSRRDDGRIIARGLMQISVQYEADLVAQFLGWHPSHFQWFNPLHSVTLGCAYLADLIRRFGTFGAVASYNCGPGRYTSGRPLPRETQKYLRKVFG